MAVPLRGDKDNGPKDTAIIHRSFFRIHYYFFLSTSACTLMGRP